MPNIRIIDSISDPGSPSRPNEDACGGNASCAFVIDGATGLGGESIVGLNGSDAAWLAQFARNTFEQLVRPGRPMVEIVRELNTCAGNVIEESANMLPIEPWNLPVASFHMIRVEDARIAAYGLGDCRLFLLGDDGTEYETSAIKGGYAAERDEARRAIDHVGGLSTQSALSGDPTVRAELRRRRAAYNRPGGRVWTLGIEPAAAAHLATEEILPALPAVGLLCSDGFAAIADQYARYSVGDLVRTARDAGLAALLRELRDVERLEDPDGQKFPRFKVSDDATAVLFDIVE